MKAGSEKVIDLNSALRLFKINNSEPGEVTDTLFSFEYGEYAKLFSVDDYEVPSGRYRRIPIHSGSCCAFLMLWGANATTAVHDHCNYDGFVKILKGRFREISYIPSENFIEFEDEKNAYPGDELYESPGSIHSLMNLESSLSVSLHIYNTCQTTLKGVRVFDTARRIIGILNEKAGTSTWDNSEDCFSEIITV